MDLRRLVIRRVVRLCSVEAVRRALLMRVGLFNRLELTCTRLARMLSLTLRG